jgi:hypothetical protein
VPHRWDDLVKIETARITVPRDLAEDLAKDGFYEVKRVRGIDVQATLTLIETTVRLSAEWLEVFETDDPDPLRAYPRATSQPLPASQIQPQLSQSFRLAGARKTNGA